MSSNAVRYSPSYTIADYALWEGDWELWNGVAVCMSPAPTPMHQLVATNIAAEIRDQLRRNPDCRCLVLAETDWQIDNATVVRPDVSRIVSWFRHAECQQAADGDGATDGEEGDLEGDVVHGESQQR